MFDILQALEKAEMQKKVPPGTTEAKLHELSTQYEYGNEGTSANRGFTGRIGNPDPIQAPWSATPDFSNFERRQHMADSMANDALLRELMGYRRARTEEDPGEGQYALARYPYLGHAMGAARGGMGGVGQLAPMGMSPDAAREYTSGRRQWAEDQAALLGLAPARDIGERMGFSRAMKGAGARERSAAFRQFLR
jgi:hypothetical protein